MCEDCAESWEMLEEHKSLTFSSFQWLSPYFFNRGPTFLFYRENYAVGLGYIVILEVSHCR